MSFAALLRHPLALVAPVAGATDDDYEERSVRYGRRTINTALAQPDLRRRVSEAGREHVIANHTYEVRVPQIIQALNDKGVL